MATKAQHYDYLVDKVVAKLHPWKARLLSPAAKVVLIKSVIEPLVLYSMGAGSQWDSSKLVNAIGFHASLYLACVFKIPPLKPDVQDRLIFKPAVSGNFSYKGACNLLEGSVNQSTVGSGIWKAVWDCPGTLPRTKMFIWKLLHDAIPVKASFSKRLRTTAPPCDVCGLDADDAMHALFLCPKARQCWLASSLGLRVDMLPQQIVPAMVFFFQQLDRQQLVLFANTLWSFWKARCKEVYEGKKIMVHQVLWDAASLNVLTNFIEVPFGRKNSLNNAATPSTQLIPDTGKVCKMDGSFKEGEGAGWAYTLYDNNVLTEYGLTAGEAICPLHAEMLALKAALHATMQHDWLEVIFYTDCEVIIKVLNGLLPPETVDWRVYTLALDIISIMKFHSNFSCYHAPRDLLRQEHDLANLARLKDLNVIGYTFPLFSGM
ncbi:Ribonuclease H-like superfamily protein [Rhynchospora pubera]|uniref:Ribonuclease H-like superfamily protein n=1 Tax=Rhynchospora pubera TaxID=906938 RepID=A0AAV8BUK2_9POAL|nr:Ribonuclease H-like superfamily protein [Rhynchospora pubera]